MPLKEDSVKGIKRKEKNSLYLLGDWTIFFEPNSIEARWSYEWTEGEDTIVILKLKKEKNEYLISNWDVETTF